MTIYRDKTPGRIRGRKLQRARAEAFSRNPLCHGPDSECEKLGRVRVWVTRDHIDPLHKQGLDTESNCQYLCAECDYSKTNRDLGRRDLPVRARNAGGVDPSKKLKTLGNRVRAHAQKKF